MIVVAIGGKMTNEEWIKSLPTEQFMRYLTCKACSRNYEDTEQDKCFSPSCYEEQLAWLKTERQENGIS